MNKLSTARNLAFLGALGALLGLWSATRTWITVDVQSNSVQIPQIVVDGATAAASVTALSIVVLAGALALLIAGKISRYIIGAISLLAGVAMIVAGITPILDPEGTAAVSVSTATGLAQNVGNYAVSAWPSVVILGAVLIILEALLVLSRSHIWPTKADKYARRAAKRSVEPKDESSRNISNWEQLSAGEDPTELEKS